MKKGKFIVIEGLDGSGNSTQAQLLFKWLREDIGIKVAITKEPTDGFIGRQIRAFLKKQYVCSPKTKQILFTADRALHLEEQIIPALSRGISEVCDRYILSSLAYGSSEGLNIDWLYQLNSRFLIPDITVLLNVRPKVCIKRIDENRNSDREFFEEEEKLKKVWKGYTKAVKFFPYVVSIDGEQSVSDIFQYLKLIIRGRII